MQYCHEGAPVEIVSIMRTSNFVMMRFPWPETFRSVNSSRIRQCQKDRFEAGIFETEELVFHEKSKKTLA